MNPNHDHRGRFTTAPNAAAPRKRPWFQLPDGRTLAGATHPDQESYPGTHGRTPTRDPSGGAARMRTRYPDRTPHTADTPTLRDALRPAAIRARRKIQDAVNDIRRLMQRRPPGRP